MCEISNKHQSPSRYKGTVKEIKTTRQEEEELLLWVSKTRNRFRCINALETRPQEDETDQAYGQIYRDGGKGSTKLRQRSRLVAVCCTQSTTTGAVATRPNSSVVRLQKKKSAKGKRRTASICGGLNRPPAQSCPVPLQLPRCSASWRCCGLQTEAKPRPHNGSSKSRCVLGAQRQRDIGRTSVRPLSRRPCHDMAMSRSWR